MSRITTPNKLSGPSASSVRQGEQGTDVASDLQTLVEDVSSALVKYSNKNPGVLCSAVFFVGFYLGWKTKPW